MSLPAYAAMHYRGDGFVFEPMGAPSGLRSTAWLFPPACSSMDLVVPGLAPVVCGARWDCGVPGRAWLLPAATARCDPSSARNFGVVGALGHGRFDGFV